MVSKFAIDEKRCRVVNNKEHGDRMQEDINHMVSWSLRMGVNLKKDKVHLLYLTNQRKEALYNVYIGGRRTSY